LDLDNHHEQISLQDLLHSDCSNHRHDRLNAGRVISGQAQQFSVVSPSANCHINSPLTTPWRPSSEVSPEPELIKAIRKVVKAAAFLQKVGGWGAQGKVSAVAEGLLASLPHS
jgi:hypothetical protein